MPLVRPPPQSASTPISSENNGLPTLGQCPRPTFVQGLEDWLQITSPRHFSNFDLCPGCYNTSFKNTRYAQSISPAPPKPEEYSTRCDFSDLWGRIAYAWLFTQNAPDLTLMGNMSEITPDEDGPCTYDPSFRIKLSSDSLYIFSKYLPNLSGLTDLHYQGPNLNLNDEEVKTGGKPAVTRKWYCLWDPKTNSLVEELTVCSDCVAHINLICPCLDGIFQPVGGGEKLLATCDLMMLNDGQARCVEYLDAIIDVAESTMKTRTRDVGPLVTHIRKWAPIPLCPKHRTATNETKYTLTSVPEFTVCEECYTKHIAPLRSKTPLPRLLSQMQSSMPVPGSGFSCDLYSPRLQTYFADAISTNDLASYRQKLVARNNKLQETKLQLERMGVEHRQLQMQADMHMQLILNEARSAASTSLAWTMSSYQAPPMDFRASNAQMNQGTQLRVQAAMVLDNMKLLEKEWDEYWE